MASNIVTSDPSFGISYKNTIGVDDLTVYQLLSNRDSLPIPTDALGANPVFTEASVVFEIKQADTDVTSSYTISESVSTNVTITVNNVNKTATVTAITADVGSFIIKAERTNYPTLTRKINVFKSKKGLDGTVLITPDNETIENDVSGNLKVVKHTYYDETGELENTFLIGDGSVTGNNTGVVPSSNNISIHPSGSSDFSSGVGCLAIGNTGFGTALGSSVSYNCISIGNNIVLGNSATSDIYNSVMIGVSSETIPAIGGDITSSRSISIGINPTNILDKSISFSFDPDHGGTSSDYLTHNNIYFFQNTDVTSTTEVASIALPLVNSVVTSFDIAKVEIDIFGIGANVTLGPTYTARDVLIVTTAGGIVSTNNISGDDYSTGDLVGTIHSHAIASNIITTTITPPGGAASLYTWIINYKVQLIKQG